MSPEMVQSSARLAGIRTTEWSVSIQDRLVNALENGSDQVLYEDLQSRWVNPNRILKEAWRIDTPARHQDVTWQYLASSAESRMAYDAATYMAEDVLVKVDRSAMAFSLETRAPFLDHRVFEFAWRIPLERKISAGVGKRVLRELLAQRFPDGWFSRPKQGFSIPLGDWLRGPLLQWSRDLVDFSKQDASPIDPVPLMQIMEQHVAGTRDQSNRLWPALVLLDWVRQRGAGV